MDRVSVIIPFRNSEQYIDNCLNSVVNQTYKNIEIILINNNSVDCSLDIVNCYMSNNHNIFLYNANKKNSVSYARNVGLQHVNGDYILFVDSDDYIDYDFIESKLLLLKKYECDAIWSYLKRTIDYNKPISHNPIKLLRLDDDYNINSIKCFTIGMIYKTSVIKENNIKFDEDIAIGEDILFFNEFIARNTLVCLTYSEPFYNYRIHQDSSYYSRDISADYTNIIAHERIYMIIRKKQYKKATINAKKRYLYKCFDLAKRINLEKSVSDINRLLKNRMVKLLPFVFLHRFGIRYKVYYVLMLFKI